jgi:hypothetical protein
VNSAADFSGLVNLITTTVEPGSWDVDGGQGTIGQEENTLSLVIRQTTSVHEQIVDLLTQLRKLQDLQVTVEVRFISVSDRFFERIGVDFDWNVNDSPRRSRRCACLWFPPAPVPGWWRTGWRWRRWQQPGW